MHSRGRQQQQHYQLRGVHTHRHHWEEQSRAQQITDLQLTCWANQDSQPYTSLTRGSQCIVRLTGVYPSLSPNTYVGLYCYVAIQEVCLLKLSSSCRRWSASDRVLWSVCTKYMCRRENWHACWKASIVRFCGREGSWLFCIYKPLGAFGECAYHCTNGAVFTVMKRQRGRKRERCTLQCLMITGHWPLCWCQQNCDLSGW